MNWTINKNSFVRDARLDTVYGKGDEGCKDCEGSNELHYLV
jgi:hypothetical protein